jgi:Flp pilus assembly pilin Flp
VAVILIVGVIGIGEELKDRWAFRSDELEGE